MRHAEPLGSFFGDKLIQTLRNSICTTRSHYQTLKRVIMHKNGTGLALAAYLSWGVFPIYFHALVAVSPLEILAHRIIWAALFLTMLRPSGARWQVLRQDWRTALTFLGTALLLACNWLTYIWAVNNGRTVDASLGYFINPLFNVMLGVLFLGERLRRWQWVAIACATAGVAYLTLQQGSIPWIGLTLAISFGFYGLLRKTAKLDSLTGLSLETIWLLLPALGYMAWQAGHGQLYFGPQHLQVSGLLLLAGVITAVPLLWFASAARQIPYSLLGIIQYITPTMQFIIGIWLFHEAFQSEKLWGFGLIWVSLLIFSIENWLQGRPDSQLARSQ
jgi:chloramphenicol-sensitive protein RarD